MTCVCLAVCGCGKKAPEIVGKWKLNTPVALPGGTSTDVTFGADHTLSGIYAGTWSSTGDMVTLKITAMGGMQIDALKKMMASQPNGAEAAKMFDSMPLKVDADGKNMSVSDGNGKTSGMPMFTKE